MAAAIDPHTISRGFDSRAGNNTINHDDKRVDALIDRMREAATEEAYLQAARTYVKGYENLHGYKLLFETTWLDK